MRQQQSGLKQPDRQRSQAEPEQESGLTSSAATRTLPGMQLCNRRAADCRSRREE